MTGQFGRLRKYLKENKEVTEKIGVALCVLGAVAIILVIGLVPMVENQPSEERCSKYYGNDTTTRTLATQWYCVYNGTAWHYNKTAYSQKMLPGLFT